jgi:hypothetical protein
MSRFSVPLSIPLAAALLCSLAACNATPSQGENARNTQMSEDPAPPSPESSSTTPSPQGEQQENPNMVEDSAGAPPSKGVSARSDQMVDGAAPAAGAKICDASKAQSAIGQVATQAVVEKVVADSGARNARVVKPGMAVTMDFREDRVGINVDADNRITSIACG